MAEPKTETPPMTDEQRERVEDPNNIDETVPGGRYIVGESVVNAHGEEIGKASKADTKVENVVEETDEPPASVLGAGRMAPKKK
jgi:hypothetical protein